MDIVSYLKKDRKGYPLNNLVIQRKVLLKKNINQYFKVVICDIDNSKTNSFNNIPILNDNISNIVNRLNIINKNEQENNFNVASQKSYKEDYFDDSIPKEIYRNISKRNKIVIY